MREDCQTVAAAAPAKLQLHARARPRHPARANARRPDHPRHIALSAFCVLDRADCVGRFARGTGLLFLQIPAALLPMPRSH
jgi:hypothetical protein